MRTPPRESFSHAMFAFNLSYLNGETALKLAILELTSEKQISLRVFNLTAARGDKCFALRSLLFFLR